MKRFATKFFSLIVALSMALGMVGQIAQPVMAVSPNIVIYQVYGGGGNSGASYTHDFVVLFNRGTSSTSLSGMSLQYASAAGTGFFSVNPVVSLSGTIAPGQYYLIVLRSSGSSGAAIPTPYTTGTTNLSTTGGKVALVNSTTGLACNGGPDQPCSSADLALIIDLVGWGTSTNFFETAAAPATTVTTAIIRSGNGCTDTDNNSTDFSTGVPSPKNTSSPLSPCSAPDAAPTVSSTTPADNAPDIALDSDVSVTFSEAVTVTSSWAKLECATSGNHAFGYSGGPTTFTIDPTLSLANNELCTLTVYATEVTDEDGTADKMIANYVSTFTTIAAVSDTSPFVSSTTPSDAAVDIAIDSNVSVTFSEAVSVTTGWAKVECATSGNHAFGYTGGPTTFTIDPTLPFVNNEICTLTVYATEVTDQDGTADALAANYVGTFTTVASAPPLVVISQVYGGGGNTDATYKNDFIELYNRGTTAVDLTGWSVQYTSATGSSWQRTNLSGTIQPGAHWLIQEAAGSSGTVNLPTPNNTGTIAMSATNGKVALSSNTTALTGTCPLGPPRLPGVIDFVGYGTANCSETSPTPALSNTTAALRNANGATDTDNNLADFTVGAPNPRNTPPPDIAPTIVSTYPANNAPDVAPNSKVSVTFSEPVTIASGGVNVSCVSSGAHLVVPTMSNSDATITLDPLTDFNFSEVCTISVTATAVTDKDEPIDYLAADASFTFTTMANPCSLSYTHTYAIQGNGLATTYSGTHTTMGVVVGDYEGPDTPKGFYIQDLTGDGDTSTSDAIFIYNNDDGDYVDLGELVRVTGTVSEYANQTQITRTSFVSCGTGSVAPVDVLLPFTTPDDQERFEGMLVYFPQTLYVTEHFELGRYGQVVLSSNDRLDQPTAVTTPGALALTLQAENNLNKVYMDDGSSKQNVDPILFGGGSAPLSAGNTLRGGDTITSMIGVMTYTYAGEVARVRPVNALGGTWNFVATNPRPASAPTVGGTVRVVGMNALNYFNTFDGLPDTVDNCSFGVGGAPTDCRGADTLAEFDRQWPKTINAILDMDPDVLGVVEIENDGYGPTSTMQDVVDKLNSATAPGTYAFIDVDTLTGQVNALGTDAIKVGLIYQPATVTPVGTTGALNTEAFVNGGDSTPRNRPSLLQAFEENATGARFLVSVNHFKSKGSACDVPDAGDGQGNCNLVRTNAANALAAWLDTDPTGTGDPDILILGDLNSYAMEDPIKALEVAGFVNAAGTSDTYSYVFDGQWGYLDYTLISNSLVGKSNTAEWHINADEPSVLDYNTDYKTTNLQALLYSPDEFRISDHDPIITGLNLDGTWPTAGITDPVDGAVLAVGIHELTAVFSKDVMHDGGLYAADNPSNYILVEDGVNHIWDTLACGGIDNAGPQPDDVEFSVDSVVYDLATFTAVLTVNSGNDLPNGRYRLFVCGTGTIRDLAGNSLNNGAYDTFSTFRIGLPTTAEEATLMPSTGFAPDRVTDLPAQTASYAGLGDLWLEIPSLKVKTAIVGVPISNSTWDVTWLGNQAGWLEGSSYPTALGNSVLTAHVWDALNKPGTFFALNKLQYGQTVIVHSYGKEYVYEVRQVMQVKPKNVDAMLKHQEDAWLTLVTCQGWNEAADGYNYRVLVRAVLVDVR